MMDADESMMSDNKRTRKVVNRKTIDYNSSVLRGLEVRTSFISVWGSYGLDEGVGHVIAVCRIVCGRGIIEIDERCSRTYVIMER